MGNRRTVWVAALMLLALLLALVAPGILQRARGAELDPGPVPDLNTWITDGEVYSITSTPATTYLGGEFNLAGPNTGRGVPLDADTGEPLTAYPRVDYSVYTGIPDGSGGWYIGGVFTMVGGVERECIARILADGTLDPDWNPGANSTVASLALSQDGSTLYAGGFFTTIGGLPRNHIAALDASTGEVTGWNPDAGSVVRQLAVSGDSIYAGGQFTTMGGLSRSRLAKIGTSGTVDPDWDPGADNLVWTLTVSGSTVYAGGSFTSIGGEPRNRIAAIDASTGTPTPWNPDASSDVRSLALSGDGTSIYAGGQFTFIGGEQRNRIAAIDTSTGTPTPWDPDANADVTVLAPSGDIIYAGGDFTSIGGEPRNRIAAIDTATGAATPWDPVASETVRSLAVYGSTVYAGGSFTFIGGEQRNNIAAIDRASGTLTDWNPDSDGRVLALTASEDGSTIYAGGHFASIGEAERNNIAAIEASGPGRATGWNPGASSLVWALRVSGSTVYAGGTFTSIGEEPRNCIAAIDSSTGTATPWDPNADSAVLSLAFSDDGSVIYAGGDFTSIGGEPRNRIAAIDTATGAATPWDPGADNLVWTLVVSSSTVYAGGDFTSIGEEPRSHMAAIDAATGAPTDWDPGANKAVLALAVPGDGSTVYAGGKFSSIGVESPEWRNRIAAIDAATGALTDWDPGATGWVYSLEISGSTIHVGGDYDQIGNRSCSGLSRFHTPTYAVLADVNPPGSGHVTGAGTYTRGEAAALGAVPGAGYSFSNWSEDGSVVSTDNPYRFEAVSDRNLTANFACLPPLITSVTPSSGPPGTVVTVAGKDFGADRGESTVMFNDVPAGEYRSWSDTRIEVVVPGGASTGPVVVRARGVSSNNDKNFTVCTPTWYLAEGTNAWGFSTYITIANPNNAQLTARLTYMDPNPESGSGVVGTRNVTLPPLSQTTVSSQPDIGNVDFSTKVECLQGKSIAVDRTMFWTGEGALSPEGHSSIGTTTPSETWYLPEGSSAWGFETWTCIQNPNPADAQVRLTYMTEGGTPEEFDRTVPAHCRASFSMASDIGAADASIQVESDMPVVAERSMYRNNRREGSCSIGATAPAADFYLAEGTTAWGFTTYVCVQNPSDSEAEVTLTYMTPGGAVPQAPFKMAANSRKTVKVNEAAGMWPTDLSTMVHSDRPIIAERAMYWDSGTGEACHASIGLDSAHMSFLLPDGQTSNGFETYTCVQNPNPGAVTVRVTYLLEGGGSPVSFTDEIPKNSRKTYNMADRGVAGRASVMVESLDGGRPVIAERAMYWNSRGAGTCTIGGYPK